MNKEETIQKLKMHLAISGIDSVANTLAADLVNEAMGTYAEQVAKERERETSIAFAEWCDSEGYYPDFPVGWFNDNKGGFICSTSSELYTIFENDKKK